MRGWMTRLFFMEVATPENSHCHKTLPMSKLDFDRNIFGLPIKEKRQEIPSRAMQRKAKTDCWKTWSDIIANIIHIETVQTNNPMRGRRTRALQMDGRATRHWTKKKSNSTTTFSISRWFWRNRIGCYSRQHCVSRKSFWFCFKKQATANTYDLCTPETEFDLIIAVFKSISDRQQQQKRRRRCFFHHRKIKKMSVRIFVLSLILFRLFPSLGLIFQRISCFFRIL